MGNNCCPLPATPTTLPPSGPAGGDLTGSYPNPQVDPLKVASEVAGSSAAQAALAQSLSGALAKYYPAAPTSLPPSGPAGGDLTGTYPNPSVDTLKLVDAISASDTAKAALADALCDALLCCIQAAGGGGAFDPVKAAAVFQDCTGAAHQVNDPLPTCAEMAAAIAAAVNALGMNKYLYNPTYDVTTHKLSFQTGNGAVSIDLSSLVIKISKDTNNAIITGSDGGLFVMGPEKYYNASCIVGRAWDAMTKVPETGSGWQSQDITTGFGGFCGHAGDYVSWVDGCLVLQPGVYGGLATMYQYNAPVGRSNVVYLSADAVDGGGSQRINFGMILDAGATKMACAPIGFVLSAPCKMRIVYTPYGQDWNMDVSCQLFCAPP